MLCDVIDKIASTDVIYQLPLVMSFAMVSAQETAGEAKHSATCFSNLRIAFPRQV